MEEEEEVEELCDEGYDIEMECESTLGAGVAAGGVSASCQRCNILEIELPIRFDAIALSMAPTT